MVRPSPLPVMWSHQEAVPATASRVAGAPSAVTTGGGAEPAASAEEIRSLARGGALSVVSASWAAVVNVGLVLLVARGLPAATAGVYFAVTSLFLLVERMCDLGTSSGIVYFLSRARALGASASIGRYLRLGLSPVVIVATLAAAALCVWAPETGALLGGDAGNAATQYLRVIAWFVPVAALSDAAMAATRGLGSMRPTAVLEQSLRPLLQTALVVVAVLLGSGLGVTVAWAAPYLATVVLALLWLRRLRRRLDATAPTSTETHERPTAGRYWRFTAPRALAGAVQVVLQRLDIVLVAVMLGPVDAAVYTAASRFIVVGQLFGGAVSQTVAPKLGVALTRGDLATSNRLFRTATTWLVLMVWPVYLTVMALAAPLLRIFGAGYDAGASVVVVLCAAMLVGSASGMVDTALIMAGKTTWNLGNAVLAVAVNVAVDLLVIPRIGIMGAALGWAAAILANNLVPLVQLAVAVGLHPFGRGWVTAVGLAGLCFGVLPGAVLLVVGPQTGAVLAALGAGTALFLAGCWRARKELEMGALLALLPTRSAPASGVRP